MGKTRIELGLFFRMILWLHFLTYVMMTFDTKNTHKGVAMKKRIPYPLENGVLKSAIVFGEKSMTFHGKSYDKINSVSYF